MNPYTHRLRQESFKVAGIAVMAVVVVVAFAMWRVSDSQSSSTIDPIEIELASWVNGERRWNGLATIPLDGDLASQAQLQSNRMASCSCLYHSSSGELGWWLNQGWWAVGENVGYTTGTGVHALFGLHIKFVASALHRENMLDPRYDAIGVAVRQSSDGRLWVTQFYGGV
jgi:uncharacterized protein YkwD